MLNAIIVDDEAPARSELRFLLDEVGGVEVTAEACLLYTSDAADE